MFLKEGSGVSSRFVHRAGLKDTLGHTCFLQSWVVIVVTIIIIIITLLFFTIASWCLVLWEKKTQNRGCSLRFCPSVSQLSPGLHGR